MLKEKNKINSILSCINLKLLIVSFLVLSSISSFSQESEELVIVPEQSIVSDGLAMLLDMIPEGKEINYGFASKSDYTKIKIGDPMYIYTLPEDSIVEQKGDIKIKFQVTNEWFLPLYVDNRIICFLFLKKKGGQQEVVGFGANYLANDLNDEEELLKNKEEKNGLLVIPSIGSKFLVKSRKDLEFYPLGVTKCKFKTKESKFLNKKELFEITFSELKNSRI